MNNQIEQISSQHRCPNCGAPLKFDPESGELFCEHCQSVVKFDKSDDVSERDFGDLVTFATSKESDITCYRCSNCGATSVAPRTTLATACPYCGSPVVLDDRTGTVVKPDTVIPFELTAEQASLQLSRWRKRKFFAPRNFRKRVKEGSVKGVYVPAWTFDAQTTSEYIGRVGYHRTRTVRRNGKTHTETYTEWRYISGRIDRDFDDIVIRANENVPSGCFEKLGPFPAQKYKAYDDEYLAGFIADHYTLEPLAAFRMAQDIMRASVRQAILQRYRADVEGEIDIDMHILQKSFKYLLVPVYVAVTKYRGKLYNQYVSGVFSDENKSGCKVTGKAPVSVWKVLATVLLCLALLGAVAWLVVNSSATSGYRYDNFDGSGFYERVGATFLPKIFSYFK